MAAFEKSEKVNNRGRRVQYYVIFDRMGSVLCKTDLRTGGLSCLKTGSVAGGLPISKTLYGRQCIGNHLVTYVIQPTK